VDLTLRDDQQQLIDAARRFLARSCDSTVVRAAESSPDGHDRKLWDVAAGMGWPALCIPEACGGAGAGLIELALIAEQAGWAAYTSPLLHQTTLVALPLVWAGTADQRSRWLPALASGEAIGAPALMAPGARDAQSSPPLPGHRDGSGWRLSADRVLVPFAAACDVYTVLAELEGKGASLIVIDAQRAGSPLRHSALGGEPLYSVSFDGVGVREADVVGVAGGGPALLSRALDCAAAVWCSYAVGLAERAVELSVTHARDRRQFGRPIGSFQAIAHRCADMRADLDAMRWLARQAAWSLDARRGTDGAAVAAANAYAHEALRRIFMHAHQVHGAIGFSLEHDLQLFTRRAKAIELTLGDATSQRRRVAASMGL
jgi:alkylation response protein AidB-like acyl-CoA dehydrogenase